MKGDNHDAGGWSQGAGVMEILVGESGESLAK